MFNYKHGPYLSRVIKGVMDLKTCELQWGLRPMHQTGSVASDINKTP